MLLATTMHNTRASTLIKPSSTDYCRAQGSGRRGRIFFFGCTFDLVSGQQCMCACAVPHPCVLRPLRRDPEIDTEPTIELLCIVVAGDGVRVCHHVD